MKYSIIFSTLSSGLTRLKIYFAVVTRLKLKMLLIFQETSKTSTLDFYSHFSIVAKFFQTKVANIYVHWLSRGLAHYAFQ